MWGKIVRWKCLLRTRKSGMEARGSSRKPPSAGAVGSPFPISTGGGVGWGAAVGAQCWQSTRKRPPQVRRRPGQPQNTSPSQQGGSGRVGVGGWEGQKQRWLPGTTAPKLYSKRGTGRAGFPRGRGVFNFFPSKALGKSASATGQLSLEPKSGYKSKVKEKCFHLQWTPSPGSDSRLSVLWFSLLHIQKMPNYIGNTSRYTDQGTRVKH